MNQLRKMVCRECVREMEKTSNLVIVQPSRREAKIASQLIDRCILEGAKMCPRTSRFLLDNYTFVGRTLFGKVVTTACLKKWDDTTYELVGHAVDSRFRGQGVGSAVVWKAIRKIERIRPRPKKLFLCTTNVGYYRRFGFETCDPAMLDQKLRTDCAKCPDGPYGPGFPPCQEAAMIFTGDLRDLPKSYFSC